MTDETRTALMNFIWLLENRDSDARIHWESNTLVYGDGGCLADDLIRPDFTPALAEYEQRKRPV